MSVLKIYNHTNFFKYTFCEFQQVDDFDFPENTNYKSKSESVYFYTEEGVYRKSNHWGRVANCRWKLIATKNYKNQQTVVAFAKWTDFYPIHSNEKIFSILVDFENQTSKITIAQQDNSNTFTYQEAQKRSKQIRHLFKDNKWATYFDTNIDELRIKIISPYINSNTSLQEIKRRFQ